MIYVAIAAYFVMGLVYGILGWAWTENALAGLLFGLFLVAAWPLYFLLCLLLWALETLREWCRK